MKNIVNITYGDETIFGHSYAVAVDFLHMTITADGRSYHVELESSDVIRIRPIDEQLPANKVMGLNVELTKEFISYYKKWLKDQDPVTLIMQEMGYFSVHDAARKALNVD